MLAGHKALITGASKGVGEVVAAVLAAEGAFVCLTARSEDGLKATADRCHKEGAAGVAVHPCNLADGEEVDRLALELLAAHGCIDILVNVAGAYPDAGAVDQLEGDPGGWDTAFSLNVLAPMRLTRLLAPAMVDKGRGHIINLGSVAGLKAVADEGAYSASKWALRGWSHSCYEALKDKGVKVMLIEPSHIATDMAQEQEGTRYIHIQPGLMIQTEDVAQAVLLAFRLSPTADPVELVLNCLQAPYQE